MCGILETILAIQIDRYTVCKWPQTIILQQNQMKPTTKDAWDLLWSTDWPIILAHHVLQSEIIYQGESISFSVSFSTPYHLFIVHREEFCTASKFNQV